MILVTWFSCDPLIDSFLFFVLNVSFLCHLLPFLWFLLCCFYILSHWFYILYCISYEYCFIILYQSILFALLFCNIVYCMTMLIVSHLIKDNKYVLLLLNKQQWNSKQLKFFKEIPATYCPITSLSYTSLL